MLTAAKFALFSALATAALPAPLLAHSYPETSASRSVGSLSDAKPAFEVATIRPSESSAAHGTGIRTMGSHVAAFNFSVGELISFSYGLQAKQITSGSPSLLETHYDVDGVPNVTGHPTQTQLRMLFQQLLVSRFQLAFHYESRKLPAYVIQIAKGGPKLAETTRKPNDSTGFTFNCQAVLSVRNASLNDVAKGMQDAFMDKPVVDQTGLLSRYDFDLKWTPDESQSYCPVNPGRTGEDPNAPPGMYTAIQEQLGLKLVPLKVLVRVMVIDRIEQPSEN